MTIATDSFPCRWGWSGLAASISKVVYLFDDLWQWDGSDWVGLLSGRGPLPRAAASMVFDPAPTFGCCIGYDPDREVIVRFGGDIYGSNIGDVWEFGPEDS